MEFDRVTEAIVTIAMGIIAVAVIATLVSKKAQTPQVIQAAASGFGNALAVAESPVTGSATAIDLNYPGTGDNSLSGALNFGG